MKKIIKGITTHTIAFVLGAIIFTIIGAYAATTLASSSVSYNNTNSGGSSTTVSGALDELYEMANKSHCPSTGTAVTFKVGDYVKMTPSSTSFTTSTAYTGYSSTQTINPSELNLWRVIRINADNTVDMVSEYVSSVDVYFKGQTGYQNFIGYLNKIAHQYENSCYTVESRHMGYNGQTEYITDTTALNATTAPQTSSTSSSNVTALTESRGLGDMGYQTDYNLVNAACGSLKANKVGTTEATGYWHASRQYSYYSSTTWTFNGRYIDTGGYLVNVYLYRYDGGGITTLDYSAIRPIVTLKSGIKATGSGTSGNPYVLN